MTGKRIDILWAFIGGGVLSVLLEGLWRIVMAIGVPSGWEITVMMMIVALIGMVTTYFGWYPKLIGRCGFGAILPFCSLASAIVGDTAAAIKEGDSLGKAARKGLKGPCFVFGTGILFTCAVALTVVLVNGKEGAAQIMMKAGEIEARATGPEVFLHAFLVGGLICLIWQIFFRINKQSVPLNLAIGVYTGAVLTGLGAMEYIVGFAGRGMVLMILNTAEGIYRGFMGAVLFGAWTGVISYLALLAFTFVLSTVVFGYLTAKKKK